MTNRFRRKTPQYSNSITVKMAPATAAAKGLGAIWKDGFSIRRAGAVLLDLVDLVDPASIPRDLFSASAPLWLQALMAAMDAVNQRYGRGAAGFGVVDKEAPWRMHQGNKTPSYTTFWDDLPVVRA